jgi:hypothetical protein
MSRRTVENGDDDAQHTYLVLLLLKLLPICAVPASQGLLLMSVVSRAQLDFYKHKLNLAKIVSTCSGYSEAIEAER